MERMFVNATDFDKRWQGLGLSDEELNHLQATILENPQSASVIQGTGGLRKMRFALKNKGKSGGIRVLYVDFEEYGITFLLTVYSKNQMDNISSESKAIFKKVIEQIEKVLETNQFQ